MRPPTGHLSSGDADCLHQEMRGEVEREAGGQSREEG